MNVDNPWDSVQEPVLTQRDVVLYVSARILIDAPGWRAVLEQAAVSLKNG